MLSHIKCEICGGVMVAQTFKDARGDRYVEGLECLGCSDRVTTSVMTPHEYREMLASFNKKKQEPPYSLEDYNSAKELGLDLDSWRDYERFYELG